MLQDIWTYENLKKNDKYNENWLSDYSDSSFSTKIALLPNNKTETNLLPTKNRHISNLKD